MAMLRPIILIYLKSLEPTPENGLHTPAMEMLTEDILNRLKTQNIKTDKLRSLLSNFDMAKFAKAQP